MGRKGRESEPAGAEGLERRGAGEETSGTAGQPSDPARASMAGWMGWETSETRLGSRGHGSRGHVDRSGEACRLV